MSTWTSIITRNLAIDALGLQRSTPTDPHDEVFLELMSSERMPEEAAITAGALVRVLAALAELPIEQRRAVLLAAMYGRTAAEIALSEVIPLGTAKSRIRTGMAKLRKAIVIEEASCATI